MSSEGWKKVQLGDILTLHYGKALVSHDRNPGFIPVYSSSGITGWHDKPLVNDKGIIIGRKGNVGSIYYSDTPFYCIDTAYYVTPDDTDVDFMFLYYLLQTLGLNGLNEDSAVPGLNRETALAQWVNIPVEKQIQNLIANQIAAFDEKIKLNRQTNSTLEAIAQAIFKEWFVDFNYPGATGEMVESELGPIPKGWSIGRVDDIVDLQPGFSFKSRDFVSAGKFRLITIKNVQDGILSLTNTNYLDEIPSRMPDYCLLNEGDILISLTGNVGRVCFVYDKDLLLNQRVAKLHPKGGMLWSYTYSLFRNNAVKADLIELSKGTAQLNLSIVETKQKSIMIPTRELLLQYELVTSDIYKKFIDNFKEQNLLTLLRETLLPKLMSGEIEI